MAAQNLGRVTLVGAGPGSPGLITVRGAEALAEADVVLFDRLANEDLLALARPGAELIGVGKAASHHTLPQEEINAILSRKAQEGLIVCRLKGGDPFVFGRGGEEASHLAKLGIPFEIVPGVTSSVAVPAFAGIPVTDRRHARNFMVVTGHTRNGELDLDWESLRADTLVFLMSHTNLEEICSALRRAGRRPETPAAVIERGTTPQQRTVTGTLADLATQVRSARLGTPALLIVGEVVTLQRELSWFETRPLMGRRILVTRQKSQAETLIRVLSRQGADVVLHPLITTRSLPLEPQHLQALAEADWTLFASANGVEHLISSLHAQGRDVRALGSARLAAIGEATAKALTQRGLLVDFVPSSYVSEQFATEIPGIEGKKVALVRARTGRPALPEILLSRGAQVTQIPAYETSISQDEIPKLESFDAITLTSPSIVESLRGALSPESLSALRSGKPKLVAIGPITAKATQDADLPLAAQAPSASAESLAHTLCQLFSSGQENP